MNNRFQIDAWTMGQLDEDTLFETVFARFGPDHVLRVDYPREIVLDFSRISAINGLWTYDLYRLVDDILRLQKMGFKVELVK